MPASSLILIGVLAPVGGVLGSLLWPYLQASRLGTSNLGTLTILVLCTSLIPIYGCLGLLPFFRNRNIAFGGLTTPGEMYVLVSLAVVLFLCVSLRWRFYVCVI
jgi:UMF1 family MFS transporter